MDKFCKEIPEDMLRRAVRENHIRELAAIPPPEELMKLYASESNEGAPHGSTESLLLKSSNLTSEDIQNKRRKIRSSSTG